MTASDGPVRRGRVRDVRALLGLHTTAARVVVAFYALTFAVVAFSATDGVRSVWPIGAAVALVSAGALLLITFPGDPLPVPATAALAAVGPVAVALVFPMLPVPAADPLQQWPLGAATAIYTFLCVRGRTGWAWLGAISMIAAYVVWAAQTGQGVAHGIATSVINLAPLLMATFFAYSIRPAATEIFQLREESTAQTAATAAAAAVLAERDAQLHRLDASARPLLEQIAAGAPLTEDDRLACRLLEAHLRDTLRAPALCRPDVIRAARSARSRGVDVVLLDDRGMDAVTGLVRGRVAEAVAAQLDAVSAGSVTARVLPPGRVALATVLVHEEDGSVRRIEYGHDGLPTAAREPALP